MVDMANSNTFFLEQIFATLKLKSWSTTSWSPHRYRQPDGRFRNL